MTGPEVVLRRWCDQRVAAGRVLAGPGGLPDAGTPEWAAADGPVRLGAVCALLLQHLDAAALRTVLVARDRRRDRDDAMIEASHAISAAVDWTAASRRPSHAELQRRRSVGLVPA